jgi:hypothetical protein
VTTIAPEATRTITDRGYVGGFALALTSASCFGLSGSLARSLLEVGWSPAAVVATRVGGAFLILLIPCLFLLRRIGLPTGRQSLRLLAYGVVACCTCSVVLFQRSAIPLGRCRVAAGISRTGHADRLALGANPSPSGVARAGRCRSRDDRACLRPRPPRWLQP